MARLRLAHQQRPDAVRGGLQNEHQGCTEHDGFSVHPIPKQVWERVLQPVVDQHHQSRAKQCAGQEGGTAVAQSGTYLFGDAANLNPKLPAYAVLNLNASCQVSPNIQLFGLVQNVTGQKYYTYGTFSPTGSVFLAEAPNATNPRSYSPAAPVGGFVGLRVTL